MSMAIKYAMMKKKKMAHGGSVDEGPSEKANQMGVNKIVPNFDRKTSEIKHGQSEARYGDKVAEHKKTLEELRSMPKPNLKGLAEGGMVEGEHQSECTEHCVQPCEIHEISSGYGEMPMEHEMSNEAAVEEDDMISRAIKNREKNMYSKGGMVANGGEDKLDHMADGKPNEFDDLALDDDLHSTIKGDEQHGDARLDEDDQDIVSRVMRSRAKKDRNPRPA